MSDIDEFANRVDNKTVPNQPEEQSKKQMTLKPLYRQFTSILMAILLTLLVTVGLTYALFYQKNVQNNALEVNQLLPLTQQLTHIKALQKTDVLVGNLLIAVKAENFVERYKELNKELIAIKAQLLQQKSDNSLLFQQWLNENKQTEDIVSRLQDSSTRNQQLKQSSIIQLQLMLLSLQPVIDSQLINNQAHHKKLQEEQSIGRVTFGSATAYAKSVQQLNDLQQTKSLLNESLLGFEQLNILTSITEFEPFRLKVEQLFSLHTKIASDETTKAMVDVNRQFETFEEMVLTKQNTLAKWQGYIRLAQGYRLELTALQQKIRQLMATPYEYTQVSGKGNIHKFFSKFDIYLSAHNIVIILTALIGFLLCFVLFLLWQLHREIKAATQHGVSLIKKTFNNPTEPLVANCAETQEIMQLVKNIVQPLHDELEYQSLSTQYQSAQQLLSEQVQKLEHLSQQNKQFQLDSKAKSKVKFDNELHHYSFLEASILRIIHKHQVTLLNATVITQTPDLSITAQLNLLYQQLAQFRLALGVQSDKSRLKLSDINLITELEAIVFNKQQEQQAYNNQLFLSYDEQLLNEVKIDFRLFQQLISLFIDIAIADRSASQIHLQVQLQDKSVGQYLVNFSAKVKVNSLKKLPDLVTQLVRSQSSRIAASPSVEILSVLLAKQHGGNVTAQLIDDGYQLSFELPLAITTPINNNKITLENNKITLLSNNEVLVELVEKVVLFAKGKFERLAEIESVVHYLSEKNLSTKYLSSQKHDVFIISSDIALCHFDYINKKMNNLPHSIRPKLMVLQSKILSYERFGFYAQAEQVFCKDTFIENILKLLASNKTNNQLLACDPFVENQFISTQLPLLLAVNSPQQYQNLQRLLQWLGLQVQVVTHEAAQKTLWKTGRYSILMTEFIGTAFLEMTTKPQIDIGVFSLTDGMPNANNNAYFEGWHQGTLDKESTLTELIEALSPWLKPKLNLKKVARLNQKEKPLTDKIENILRKNDDISLQSTLPKQPLVLTYDLTADQADDLVITQVADVYANDNHDATFDFSHYLHNQGSVELALFMLDDYCQDNHQQLDVLIEAFKAKRIAEANVSIAALTLNAKILAAPTLEALCKRWTKLLSCSEIPNSLEIINALIKDTRLALNDIDSYAETF